MGRRERERIKNMYKFIFKSHVQVISDSMTTTKPAKLVQHTHTHTLAAELEAQRFIRDHDSH